MKEQFRAIWANQLMTAKLMFINLVKDKRLLSLFNKKTEAYKLALDIAYTRMMLGVDAPFVYDIVLSKNLALEEDIRQLNNLIFEETKQLQYYLGIDIKNTLKITGIKLPLIEELTSLDPELISLKAIISSPEINQFNYLLNSLKWAEANIYFTILGISKLSAGTGDGVYDEIPIQDGLGFGLGPSIRISESKKELISLQKKATSETIEKQSEVLVYKFNSLLKGFKSIKEREEIADRAYETLKSTMSLGKEVSPLVQVDVINNSFSASVTKLAIHHFFRQIVEKIQRITFSNDYNLTPINIEELINWDSEITEGESQND